ncbi:Niacin transporter NiaP [Desulfosporosinus sp. I2]|uniref:MFS transporter n=1 Tax=Desulfosporosinus sp. I2 TaxID=1617025 RepID=UPI0005EE5D24|nr:MFS transporter [Desulfosporosinus sp. I2]KJR48431.1 Niacin transporter NiaP [Desulfosporosinus sp. I2]
MSQAQVNLRIAQRFERLPLTSYQRLIFATIVTCWLFDAIDLGSLTFVLGSIKETFNLTTAQAGLVSSASFLGMAFGASLSGMAADRWGRKLIFQISMIIWGLGSLFCALAQTPEQFAMFRIMLGFGMGMEFPIGQALVSEFMPAKNRGRYIAMLEGLWPIGFILAGVEVFLILPLGGWRWVFIAQAIPAVFIFFFRKIVPESPRWLDDVERYDEAERVMSFFEAKVQKAYGKELPPVPDIEYNTRKKEKRFSFMQLWAPGYAKRTILVWFMWFSICFGYYGLTTWLSALLQQAGYSVTKSVFYTIEISLAGIPGFLFAAYIVERFGRKPALIFELIGCAGFVYLYGSASSLQNLIIFGLCMQFCLFGMWSALYAYTPELYPTRARTTGTGFASGIGRVGSLIGISLVGVLLPKIGNTGVFIMGAACFILVAIAVGIFGEETKGRVLEEISP